MGTTTMRARTESLPQDPAPTSRHGPCASDGADLEALEQVEDPGSVDVAEGAAVGEEAQVLAQLRRQARLGRRTRV